MERSVTVRTPEAIAFYYELAGLGSRFLALLIDTIFQSIALGIILGLGFLGARGAHLVADALRIGPKTFESTLSALIIVVLFLVFWAYFVVFEALWNGQTPGKKLLGIRVVRDGGYPVGFMDSIIRNLIRILEFGIGFYFISVISMLLSSENKRLGDYAAGTIVVRDRGMEVRDPKSWLQAEATNASAGVNGALSKLSADDLALVDFYAARKTSLNPRASQEAAAKIASVLRPKLDPELAQLPDAELLMRIWSRDK